MIDESIETSVESGNAVNAAQHVWGYVNDLADENTKFKFEKSIDKVSTGGFITPMKRLLWKLALEQEQEYLLNSLYFMEFM